MDKENKRLNSRERLAQYGEYYTPPNVVDCMLTLVENQMRRIDSRFLEPACGTGNFLEPVLINKLRLVEKYKKHQFEYEQYSLLALGSIYGIDILEDNVQLCRDRLLLLWENAYRNTFSKRVNENVIKSAEYIINTNIVCGDALLMVDNHNEPLVLSEWSIIRNGKMQQKEFVYSSLLNDPDSITPYGTFIKQFISDYWRIWDHVN